MKSDNDKLISEAEVMRLLGLKKSDLDKARNEKGLPFVKISVRARAYFLSDLMEWAWGKRIAPQVTED